MRCACIDIGTNTTRVLVAEVRRGRLDAVLQERAFTRLAHDGEIPEETIAHVAAVVCAQLGRARAAGAGRVKVVATAAIRVADNREALLERLQAATGLEPVVLSGADEARLAFAGATAMMPAPPAGRIAVVDVGGGSTEVAVGSIGAGVAWAESYPVGSSSLTDDAAPDPPAAATLDAIRARADAAFSALAAPAPDAAVAVGGSAASLPTLVGRVLDAAALERALAVLRSAPAAEVARRHGLAPERVRLLPAGILVLDAVARRLGRTMHIGTGGLREGVVLELANLT
jgi:exopolyphosphatase/guanosine-5'-triphosphate,3'-diphosphate pyrophosphatase